MPFGSQQLARLAVVGIAFQSARQPTHRFAFESLRQEDRAGLIPQVGILGRVDHTASDLAHAFEIGFDLADAIGVILSQAAFAVDRQRLSEGVMHGAFRGSQPNGLHQHVDRLAGLAFAQQKPALFHQSLRPLLGSQVLLKRCFQMTDGPRPWLPDDSRTGPCPAGRRRRRVWPPSTFETVYGPLQSRSSGTRFGRA